MHGTHRTLDIPIPALCAQLTSLNTTTQAPDDPPHVQDSQCTQSDSSITSTFTQVLPRRFYTKIHIHPLFLQIVSQGTAHPPQTRPYKGTVSVEVFVRRLRIRIVSQGVACTYSVGLGGCLLDRMCFFTYPRGYTLYICLCVSFV